MRRMLNPAFSQRGLLGQEEIITGVVDKFVKILGEKGGPGSRGLNMTKWYEMNSFDILGEMAFGESFHSLDTGELTSIAAPQRVSVRLSVEGSRNDFVSLLVEKVRNGEVGKEEMTAHVSTMTYDCPYPDSWSLLSEHMLTHELMDSIAGGETVATTLTGLTCFLVQNPEKLQQLVDEVRGAFKSYDEINATAAQQLPYLQAVLNEGLRLFPPASGGAPRVSPGFELHGYHIPSGTEINVSPWTITHDEKYFAEPWEFRPERWLGLYPTDVKEASRPFLLGPRDCLGRK
ncbi:uncharacterized protein PG986_005366 [Apiospora aurea]|uniref:Cytochrome P450 monooxygenase n=1 Tax=Apiospora aurea TaxID=335848 RepID=A0ABR1QHS2_9PEZI